MVRENELRKFFFSSVLMFLPQKPFDSSRDLGAFESLIDSLESLDLAYLWPFFNDPRSRGDRMLLVRRAPSFFNVSRERSVDPEPVSLDIERTELEYGFPAGWGAGLLATRSPPLFRLIWRGPSRTNKVRLPPCRASSWLDCQVEAWVIRGLPRFGGCSDQWCWRL